MTQRRYLLGVDISTSVVKAAIFNEDGNLVSLSQQEYRFQHPKTGYPGVNP